MKIVIAIDSFKGSLTSLQAGKAAAEGIHRVFPQAQTVIKPIADGGEGTVDALVEGMGGKLQVIEVTGPLGDPVQAAYGLIEESKTAVIEMSAAAGLTLVPEDRKNPLYTTTFGVGELIIDAINKGCRNFIVGIGGSATNDGGVGMLQALGFGMLDEKGRQVPFGAEGVGKIRSINNNAVPPVLRECKFRIACSVKNPLCGENGCSAIYGPKKGATAEMIALMNIWLQQYADLTRTLFPNADATLPGAGAAGGLGFAFLTYLNGQLLPGIDIVLREINLESCVADADLVVTGQGRLDAQTVMGKAPVDVAAIAKKHGKPVLAFSGCVTPDAGVCNAHGIDAFFPVLRTVCTPEEALQTNTAYRNLAATAEQVFRLIQAMKRDK